MARRPTRAARPSDPGRVRREGASQLAPEAFATEVQERWEALLEFSPHPVLVLRVSDATVLVANPEARDAFGISQVDERVRFTSLLSAESARSVRARLREVAGAGEPLILLKQAVWPGRGTVPVELRFAPVRWYGEPAVLAKVRDMSDHVALEHQADQLLAVEEKFRQAFDEAAIGMALVSVGPVPPAGTFLEVNRAMSQMLGRSPEQLAALTFNEVSHPEDSALGLGVLRAVSAGEVGRGVVEKRYIRPDGREVWARVTTSAVRDRDGRVLHLVSQAEDVTARKEAELALIHEAMHDSLTGLPNRRHLMERLEASLARVARTARVVGLLYLDVDDFKDVNDSLGHAVGDEVLIRLAARVSGLLRAGDLAARLGGDELVMLCEDLADPGEVEPIARRLVDAVAEPIEVGGHVLHLTASVGVATGGVGATPMRLVRDADGAMYRAKGSGKARYEIGDDALAAVAMRQIETYDGLHRALDRGEFRLVYQPILDLASDRITAVEALLRWHHPERGVVGPGEFIDVAESRELIVPIGTWVLQEAVRQAAVWVGDQGKAAPRVWINVSDRQVGRHDLTGTIRAALDATGLSPDLLGVELTERQLVRTAHSVRDDLAAIRRLGVRLAIDDFGTGRTGIDYLRELPVSNIKIDRTFTMGLGEDRTNTALTDAIITLSHGLGLTVTAEGVETPEQLALLRAWGCDRAQGFLIGRPQTPEALSALLVARGGGALPLP